MQKRIPIGIDDFRKLRELGLEYVDKSHLIREVLDDVGVEVVLLPRPRRFGKTLNLSMLRCFLERCDEDLSPLFEGLSIAEGRDPYRRHFQRYPVIHLTFKGVKLDDYEACWRAIRSKIEALFDESAMAHGESEQGAAIAAAVLPAIQRLDEERARFYGNLVLNSLNEAARRALEAMMKGLRLPERFREEVRSARTRRGGGSRATDRAPGSGHPRAGRGAGAHPGPKGSGALGALAAEGRHRSLACRCA
jgi:hypothetical protein